MEDRSWFIFIIFDIQSLDKKRISIFPNLPLYLSTEGVSAIYVASNDFFFFSLSSCLVQNQ